MLTLKDQIMTDIVSQSFNNMSLTNFNTSQENEMFKESYQELNFVNAIIKEMPLEFQENFKIKVEKKKQESLTNKIKSYITKDISEINFQLSNIIQNLNQLKYYNEEYSAEYKEEITKLNNLQMSLNESINSITSLINLK